MFGIDDIAAAAIGGSILDAGVSLWNNKRNIDFAKQNLSWQKHVQETTWNREDNAVQRRAADLKAAGFNPLLAAGGAASSGQAVATTAPQGNMKTNFAETAIALARAQNDISMTRSQQELLKQQADVTRQNADLLRMQKEWYKNHPEYAPGAPSGTPEQRANSYIDLFMNTSQRIRDWNSRKRSETGNYFVYGHPEGSKGRRLLKRIGVEY